MKKFLSLAVIAATLFSCQKQQTPALNEPISQDVLAAISKAGFSTEGVIRENGGYVVEGDIFIDDNHLRTQPQWGSLIIAQTEQYSTNNLVTAPRTITIGLDSKLPSSYGPSVDEMINRYNAQNLTLKFARATSGTANITFVSGNGSYLASAGFPTSTGDPFNQVKINARAIGTGTSTTFINYLATIMAHEVGHCIGFRHTDYMDRSFSCGGATSNEGTSTVGANLIPGTPSTPDAGSWMLACIGSGVNRPFNANDRTALNFLY